jgi:FAD/FMN-containing dehydrogenase
LRPSSTSEVSALLRICNENRVPVVAFGTGTGLEGSSIPIYHGITVDMRRMDQIIEINEADFDCWIQPGVTRKGLNERIRDTGLFFSVGKSFFMLINFKLRPRSGCFGLWHDRNVCVRNDFCSLRHNEK